jgi:hypothetical protein
MEAVTAGVAPPVIEAPAEDTARRHRRLRAPSLPTGRRIRSGAEAAAATVYAVTLPRVRGATARRLRRRRREPIV